VIEKELFIKILFLNQVEIGLIFSKVGIFFLMIFLAHKGKIVIIIQIRVRRKDSRKAGKEKGIKGMVGFGCQFQSPYESGRVDLFPGGNGSEKFGRFLSPLLPDHL
jgi:hypothetical protein